MVLNFGQVLCVCHFVTPASLRLLNDARRVPLRQEQISGHSETLRQRADMCQRQPPFAAQNHCAQGAVNAQ
jgi:hypothetical protein